MSPSIAFTVAQLLQHTCTASTVLKTASVTGIVSAKSVMIGSQYFFLELCGRGEAEGEWVRTAVLVKDKSILKLHQKLPVGSIVLITELKRQLMDMADGSATKSDNRWIFSTSSASTMIPISQQQATSMERQCAAWMKKNDSRDECQMVGEDEATEVRENETMKTEREREADARKAGESERKTFKYKGKILEYLGDGIYSVESPFPPMPSDEEVLPDAEASFPSVCIFLPHIHALDPSVKVGVGQALTISGCHVVELSPSPGASEPQSPSHVLACCGTSFVSVTPAAATKAQAEQLECRQLEAIPIFRSCSLLQYAWAVSLMRLLAGEITSFGRRAQAVAKVLEISGLTQSPKPNRVLEFLDHEKRCSVADGVHRCPLPSLSLAGPSLLLADLAALTPSKQSSLPFKLFISEFTNTELAIAGPLLGQVKSSASGDLYLCDKDGEIRLAPAASSGLCTTLIGSTVLVTAYTLVVEKLPYFEREEDENPYALVTAKQKQEAKERTLEGDVRYIVVEAADCHVLHSLFPADDAAKSTAVDAFKGKEMGKTKASRKYRRLCLLVTRKSALRSVHGQGITCLVAGFVISDALDAANLSEVVVDVRTKCGACAGGVCGEMHVSGLVGGIQVGETYAMKVMVQEDGSLRMSYVDQHGVRPIVFHKKLPRRPPDGPAVHLQFSDPATFSYYSYLRDCIMATVPTSSLTVTDPIASVDTSKDAGGQSAAFDEADMSPLLNFCCVLYAKSFARETRKWNMTLKVMLSLPESSANATVVALRERLGARAELWVFCTLAYPETASTQKKKKPKKRNPKREQLSDCVIPVGLVPGCEIRLTNVSVTIPDGAKKPYLVFGQTARFEVTGAPRTLFSSLPASCPRDLTLLEKFHMMQPFPYVMLLHGNVTKIERAAFTLICDECDCSDCYHRGDCRVLTLKFYATFDDGTGEATLAIDGDLAVQYLKCMGLPRKDLVRIMTDTNRAAIYCNGKMTIEGYFDQGRDSMEKRKPKLWKDWMKVADLLSHVSLATAELEMRVFLERVRINTSGKLQFNFRVLEFGEADSVAMGYLYNSLLVGL